MAVKKPAPKKRKMTAAKREDAREGPEKGKPDAEDRREAKAKAKGKKRK